MSDINQTPTWATRKYIKMERELQDLFPQLQLPKIPQEDLDYIADNRDNFEKFREECIEDDNNTRLAFVKRTQASSLVKFLGMGIKTGDEVSRSGQAIVNEFWQDCASHFNKSLDACPQLTLGFIDKKARLNAFVDSSIGEGFIHISQRYFKIVLENIDSNGAARCKFRCTVAHEMGHILNGDANPDDYHKFTRPYNPTREILADRLGAIVCGNPRGYLDNYIASNLPGLDEVLQNEPLLAMRQLMQLHHGIAQKHQNPSRQLRMLRRWAEILEGEGAADPKTGDIVDIDRAIYIYQRSKNITSYLADIEDFARYGFRNIL